MGVVCFLFTYAHSNSTTFTCLVNGKQTSAIFKKLSWCEILRLGSIYFYTTCLIFLDLYSKKRSWYSFCTEYQCYKVHWLSSSTPPVFLGVTMENLAMFIYALLDVEEQPLDETVLNPLIELARSGNVSFALVAAYWKQQNTNTIARLLS
jgi:hypothetical protein